MSGHVLRITHDPESHAEAEDCHDGCTAEVICPGVTNFCRVWWECDECQAVRDQLDELELDHFDDQLYEDGEAHGVDHQRIDGMWMTPGTTCFAHELETNAHDFVDELAAGDHPIDLDCDEGYVYLRLIVRTPE